MIVFKYNGGLTMIIFKRKYLIQIFSLIFLLSAQITSAGKLRTFLKVEIDIDQVSLTQESCCEGNIVIINASSRAFPAIFDIFLYRNNKLTQQFITSVPNIPFGKTSFSFDSFGIPKISSEDNRVGVWKLVIQQQNTSDENKVEKEFELK